MKQQFANNSSVITKDEKFGKVISYVKGWYEIQVGKDIIKSRAKDLTEYTPEGTRLNPDHSRYTKHSDSKTASGRPRYDTSDEIATAFRAVDQSEHYALAEQILSEFDVEISVGELKDKYGHLNKGMVRMNLSNKCRGAQRRFAKAQAKAETQVVSD